MKLLVLQLRHRLTKLFLSDNQLLSLLTFTTTIVPFIKICYYTDMKDFIKNLHTYIFANILAVMGTLLSCAYFASIMYDKIHPTLYDDFFSGLTEVFIFFSYIIVVIVCLVGFIIEIFVKKWLNSSKSENFRNSKFYQIFQHVDLPVLAQKIHIIVFWFLLLIGSAKMNFMLFELVYNFITYKLSQLFELIHSGFIFLYNTFS